MTAVNLVTKHDYITLSVVFPNKCRVNMTWNRYGEKVSASAPRNMDPSTIFPRDTLKAILEALKAPKGTLLGDWTKKLSDHLRKAQPEDVAEVLKTVQGLRKSG